MKLRNTEVFTENGIGKARLWAEFSYEICGDMYDFKVTSAVRGNKTLSAIVLTERTTGFKVCDVPFSVIAATSDGGNNDYAAAGLSALLIRLSGLERGAFKKAFDRAINTKKGMSR